MSNREGNNVTNIYNENIVHKIGSNIFCIQ